MQRDLEVTYLAPAFLAPRARNPRTHSKKQIRQIADSIRQFGFITPVLVNPNKQIVAGHARVEAAKLAGIDRVPTVCVGHLTPTQIRAYVIADNKLAENAGWDIELLLVEIEELKADTFEINLIGIEPAELDRIWQDKNRKSVRENQAPEPLDGPAVSRRGDIWQIGNHRLICGDATNSSDYQSVLRGEAAQMVFADPPFNVRVDSHATGKGKFRHREFAMASGEMTEAEFTQFLEAVFANLARFSTDGSLHFVCMDWRHMREILEAGRARFSELKNLCVWVKSNGGMGSLYRSRHELLFLFKNGTAPHTNNVELGKHGRNRTNVWEYPGENSFGTDRDAELSMHPTVKPVEMVADAMLDCSELNGIVLDPFSGSGSTLIAAESVGRTARAIEIDPAYVDVAIRRFRATYGVAAVLESDGRTLDEIAEVRREKVSEFSMEAR